MKLYSLVANGREVCSVEVESPSWLPVRPRVPKYWLRKVIVKALALNLAQPAYLRYDRSTGSPILN